VEKKTKSVAQVYELEVINKDEEKENRIPSRKQKGW